MKYNFHDYPLSNNNQGGRTAHMNIGQVKGMIYRTEIMDYMRDGMALSEPVPLCSGEKVLDSYFAYYVNVKDNLMSLPCFSFIIDSEQGKLVSIKKGSKSMEEMEEIKGVNIVISKKNIPERRHAGEIYKELYPEIREWFYQVIEIEEQKRKISQFYKAFCCFTGEGKIPFYKNIAPEYFKWIENI